MAPESAIAKLEGVLLELKGGLQARRSAVDNKFLENLYVLLYVWTDPAFQVLVGAIQKQFLVLPPIMLMKVASCL